MCGRYVQARASSELLPLLEAELAEGAEIRPSWNIAPTSRVPILLERLDEDGIVHREVHTARWGLLPRWAKELRDSVRAFNARSETVTEKPTFRSAVRHRRCAVPADAYYEWLTQGRTKTPHAVRPAEDEAPILFAGLYEWWRDPAGGEEAPWVLSCTILTGPAPTPEQHSDLATLHDRMPLALSPETATTWLHPGELSRTEAEHLVELVRSEAYDVASGWCVHPVSAAVGSVRHDSPELLEPADQRLW